MRARSLLCLALATVACGKKPAATEAPAEPSAAPLDPEPTAILYRLPKKVPEVAALGPRVYIRSAPSPAAPEIGALHIGGTVDLREPKTVGNEGCAGGWVAVEPEGYVCLDRNATLDVAHNPVLAATKQHRGDFTAPAPYRWAESREAPLYRKVPTLEEQKRSEYDSRAAPLARGRAAKGAQARARAGRARRRGRDAGHGTGTRVPRERRRLPLVAAQRTQGHPAARRPRSDALERGLHRRVLRRRAELVAHQ